MLNRRNYQNGTSLDKYEHKKIVNIKTNHADK